MRACKVVEGALRDRTHDAAHGMRGLRHRVESAVATDGDHGRARGDRPCRRLVRHAGQLGGAAEQQFTAPTGNLERGLNDLAFRVCVTTACCGVDDELQR